MDNQPMTPAAELVQLLRVIYAITHDTAPRGLVTSAAINMLPGLIELLDVCYGKLGSYLNIWADDVLAAARETLGDAYDEVLQRGRE